MSVLQLVEKCTAQEWQVPLELSPLPSRGIDKGLWIDPVAFLQVLNGWALALWAIQMAQRLGPAERHAAARELYRAGVRLLPVEGNAG